MKAIGVVIVTQFFHVEAETTDADAQRAADALMDAYNKDQGKSMGKRVESFASAIMGDPLRPAAEAAVEAVKQFLTGNEKPEDFK